MPTGIVKYFKAGHYGHIIREDGGRDILVPAFNILGAVKNLIGGELVEFEEAPDRDGRPVAINVRRLETRVRGTVLDWDANAGIGHVATDDGARIILQVTSILGGFEHLEPGEPVEFTVRATAGESEAMRLERLDPRGAGKRTTGKVLTWRQERGFGSVEPEIGGPSVFVHHSGIMGTGFKRLEEGEPVEYCVVDGPKGPQARDLMRLDDRMPLEKFANLGRFDDQLVYLAKELAQHEPWDYRRKPTGRLPILWSYIHHTFMRLQTEQKIAYANTRQGAKTACFNTGLVTRFQQEIFAVFTENRKRDPDDPQWYLMGFFDEAMPPLHAFSQKPELATYWTDPADLVFDPSRRVEVDKHHIIEERGDRFPEAVQGTEQMMLLFLDSMINMSLRRVLRNYKTAVPQYHLGRVELLLPLCLNTKDPQSVDLALVLSRQDEVYQACTVLPLDWAYRNARLLAKPDPEWLVP